MEDSFKLLDSSQPAFSGIVAINGATSFLWKLGCKSIWKNWSRIPEKSFHLETTKKHPDNYFWSHRKICSWGCGGVFLATRQQYYHIIICYELVLESIHSCMLLQSFWKMSLALIPSHFDRFVDSGKRIQRALPRECSLSLLTLWRLTCYMQLSREKNWAAEERLDRCHEFIGSKKFYIDESWNLKPASFREGGGGGKL